MIENLVMELDGAKRVGIAGHIRPDGDCTGSCMGLYLYIKEYFPEIQADVYMQKIAESFHFLKDTEEIKNTYSEEIVYDVFIALDAADKDRLGDAVKYFDSARKTICIDHHVSNEGYADVNHIDAEASSTAELVFDLLEEEKITKAVAEALYLGIIHDTGMFHHASTSAKTMLIAGKLMEKGINYPDIVDNTFYNKTYLQNQILGRALLESMMMLDGKCIVSRLRKADMDFFGVTSGDLEGIVNQLRVTVGVEVAIFIYEIQTHEHKVSLRSNGKVDVNKVATYFGGGGHRLAAGCTMAGTAYDVVNNLLRPISQQLKKI